MAGTYNANCTRWHVFVLLLCDWREKHVCLIRSSVSSMIKGKNEAPSHHRTQQQIARNSHSTKTHAIFIRANILTELTHEWILTWRRQVQVRQAQRRLHQHPRNLHPRW
jgi:hypothetical protein